jgi:hypothetical protein
MVAGPFVDTVSRCAQRLGMTHAPRVYVGDETTMPMVWGFFRPVLLLPATAALWPRARLEAVILHELAHVRRRDALTQFLAEIARAIYWFNPLVWLAARRLYIEREHACDDIVLNAGTRPSEYAGELLDLVRSLRPRRATALAAIAMARPSQLKVRLHAVLDEARSRRSLTRRFVLATAFLAIALLLPVAALQPRPADAAVTKFPTLDLGYGRAESAVGPVLPAPGHRVAGAGRGERSQCFRACRRPGVAARAAGCAGAHGHADVVGAGDLLGSEQQAQQCEPQQR